MSTTITALLVDDEAVNRNFVRSLLKDAHADVVVIGEANNIADAELLIAKHAPQLLFLDVEMPDGSGFDLLRRLQRWDFEVIFVTGFQKYAIQAIRFSALDYLQKPVQPDELAAALDRYHQRHQDIDVRGQVQEQFIANIAQPDPQHFKLTLTSGDRTYFVAPGELSHCLADDNYTEFHTADGRRFVSARTLKYYEDMLAPLGFVRVHRNALVNKPHITHLDDGHVVLKNNTRVVISRRRKEEVMKALTG